MAPVRPATAGTGIPTIRLPRRPALVPCAAAAALLALAACDGPQSALDTAGRDAESIARLWWIMAAGAVVVWLAVSALILYAARVRPVEHGVRQARLLIVVGGAVFPVVVLTALLTYGLVLMPTLRQPAADPDAPRIGVSGEQWWWRVRYLPPGGRGAEGAAGEGAEGAAVELANEIRLPIGVRTELILDSPDVIHSLWIPALAGKLDMIPGRITRLVVEPTRTGVFRGVCAEYCGTSHAWMAFDVVVAERAEFDAWLAHQSRPAVPPPTPLAARGGELFLAHGCGACHAVRGTQARGVVGPDLTHVGGRRSIAAGTLPNGRDALRRFVAASEAVKPGVHMPAFGMLPDEDLTALAAYLEGLE